MRKAIAAAVIIAVSASTTACGNRAEADGTTISRNFAVGAFSHLEVAGPYDVEVRTGAKPSVSASGPEKLLERTLVEVRGNKLIIRPEKKNSWLSFGWSGKDQARFVVTVPELGGATLAGSGDIRIDQVRGPSFEARVAGSGALGIGAVDVRLLKISIAGSGDAKAGPGKAESAEYDIAGSGGVEAGGIAAQALKVSIAGSGSVSANAARTADVSIVGSGDVAVTGGAKCNVRKTGSGGVRCS